MYACLRSPSSGTSTRYTDISVNSLSLCHENIDLFTSGAQVHDGIVGADYRSGSDYVAQ
jgi:hypothetical protein